MMNYRNGFLLPEFETGAVRTSVKKMTEVLNEDGNQKRKQ